MTRTHQVPEELAKKIVTTIHNITGSNVNFMGENGLIIATIQKERLGTIHEIAKRIMNGEIESSAITLEEASHLKGVLPGYNGAIKYQGKIIGCLGISGDPVVVKPLQKMAAIIVEEEIDKIKQMEERQNILDDVSEKIHEISAFLEEISAGAEEIASASKIMENTEAELVLNINNITKVITLIESISKRTNLLGLNAAIEAARAGEQEKFIKISNHKLKMISQICIKG
ncbi:sugar diacid recognition domain-containing protein [Clostridium magnum]|uniref:Carbohydrate diacid regulator n=1 Tax=Clostridium magnum DSM 2767 TaxID=1121326 RepID=A0A162RNH3_9CLOT|nr:sugar diacid recognition domain-containing protein [Clostridium magnum]KZL90164.1 carbohydrate diacid regulator [Clostridium magnum DSM 2767]SHH62873.1 Methyl-accepting chemotaxis protein (MCP) signalling domain-containing protein [Clostridium magnum DSM 2767]